MSYEYKDEHKFDRIASKYAMEAFEREMERFSSEYASSIPEFEKYRLSVEAYDDKYDEVYRLLKVSE